MTSTPIQVQTQLEEQGYKSNFAFRDGEMICVETGSPYAPSQLMIDASYRFEGSSNPDDMSILLALTASDGTRGMFMDAFGINGDPEAAEFCAKIPDARDSSPIMAHLPTSKTIKIETSSPR